MQRLRAMRIAALASAAILALTVSACAKKAPLAKPTSPPPGGAGGSTRPPAPPTPVTEPQPVPVEPTGNPLDTRDLDIRKVEAATGTGVWTSTTHRLDAATPAFGSALRIAMPPGADRVRITYSSSSTAKGLQWLTPAQTAGGKHPFLFSQAQAIRST